MSIDIIHVCCGYHGEGRTKINGRKYRWEFHRYCGPVFYRGVKDELFTPGPYHKVWQRFNRWVKRFDAKQQMNTGGSK